MILKNAYRYCITYGKQYPKARRNGFCRNTDRENCKETERMNKLISKIPLYGK